MENSITNKIFNAAIYVRLSKEDGDKVESDSIVNQKELIRDYLKGMPDICVCSERVDDGFSGVSFDRPDFLRMMEDVRAGKINCIIVKDLSRFGRNFVEAGRYIDQIFPFLGVRFISINDGYDSYCQRSSSDKILIPFKNLINDAYCRDISVKIRSQLEIKRKKGDFIGSFAVYGYLKTPEDRHKLMVDEYASTVVQDIFKWKLQGMSQKRIADRLNELGILSPIEYKRFCGMKYKSGFQTNPQAKWTAVSVGRILRNEFYIGTLVQGRRSTPNHKIRTQVLKPQEDWIRVENSHEAIIAPEDFRAVNRLLMRDMRVAPSEEMVYLFSGLIFCADCRKNMVRNSVCQNGKTYIYYMCGSNRKFKECTAHRMDEKTVEQAIFQSLKSHIESIINVERILNFINNLPFQQNEVKKIDAQLVKNREEIERCTLLKSTLYESMISGVHTKTEYLEMKEMYENRRKDALAAEARLQKEIDAILTFKGDKCHWIERFKQYRDITALTRVMVVTLIDKILIHEGMRIDIHFKYQYDFDRMIETIENVNRIQPIPMLMQEREAM